MAKRGDRSRQGGVTRVLLWASVFFVIVLGMIAAYDLWDRVIGFDEEERVAAPDLKVLGRIDLNLVDETGKSFPGDVHADVVCLDGYKYLLLGRYPNSGITQVFRWDEERRMTVPVSCQDYVPIGLHEHE